MAEMNLILQTDSYKASHYLQYPPGTEKLFAYLESRGGSHPQTRFFGLQALIKEHLLTPISREDVDEAEEIFTAHGLPFPREGWMRIVTQHGGLLPLEIRAVPEGELVPTSNVLLTVESTDPQLPWLVSWIETLLVQVWYPTTVCTRSYYLREIIREHLEVTADDPLAELPFKLHDFGCRGATSMVSAALGGLGHLVNFQGTDTVPALVAARNYYGAGMAGYSIPAAEHSTIIAWGREREVDAYKNMLKHFARPGSVVAVVSDSYDIYHATDRLWGEVLRKRVIESGATVVIRPDSGDPVEMVNWVVSSLAEKFGTSMNKKGYRVLNHVKVIHGDQIDDRTMPEVLRLLTANGFSSSNIVFGIGSGLLQNLNRDTHQFAFKVSEVTINGQEFPVRKSPVGSFKHSKAGNLDLIRDKSGMFRTIDRASDADESTSVLVPVFKDGVLLRDWTLEEIRERA
jgi:nicotinamide phosphoribosyltransferase